MMPLRLYRAFKKQANSEVQKPTGVGVFRFFLADLWRNRTLLKWVQKVMFCDLWLVNFDPFCVFLFQDPFLVIVIMIDGSGKRNCEDYRAYSQSSRQPYFI